MTIDDLVAEVVSRIQRRGYAQVTGYNKFGFVAIGKEHVIVSREMGKDTRVPFAMIRKAIEAVRTDHRIYHQGPSALRAYGITHITSPLWAMVHLLTLKEMTH